MTDNKKDDHIVPTGEQNERYYKQNNMDERRIQIIAKKDEILNCFKNNEFTNAFKSILNLVNKSKLDENRDISNDYDENIKNIFICLEEIIDDDINLIDETERTKIQGLVEITSKLYLALKGQNAIVEKLRNKFTFKLNVYFKSLIDNHVLNEANINVLSNLFILTHQNSETLNKNLDEKSKENVTQLKSKICRQFDMIEIDVQTFLQKFIQFSFAPTQIKLDQLKLMTKLSIIPDVVKRHKKLQDDFESYKFKEIQKVAALSFLLIAVIFFFMTSVNPNRIIEETNDRIDTVSINIDTLNSDSLTRIVKNVKKLDSFKKSPLRYIDFTDIEAIDDKLSVICRRVSQILLKYLNKIELLITATNEFDQAENNMNNFLNILNNYAKYFETPEIKSKLFGLEGIFDETLKSLSTKYSQITLNALNNEETKVFLGKLHKLASVNIKYKKVFTDIKTSIVKLIDESMTRLGNSKWENGSIMKSDETDNIMIEISEALAVLPIEMKTAFDAKFKTLKESIIKKRKDFEKEYDLVTISGDFNSIKSFISKCKLYDMLNLVDKTNAFLHNKMEDFEIKIEALLSDSKLKEALNTFASSVKLNHFFKAQLNDIYLRIEAKLAKNINKLGDDLEQFERYENTKQIEKAFDEFSLFLEFKENFNKSEIECELLKKIIERTNAFLVKVNKVLSLRQSEFRSALENHVIVDVKKSMNDMKKWTPFLNRIIHNEWLNDQYQINKDNSYINMVSKVTRELKRLKSEAMDVDIIVEGFSDTRDKFFQKFAKNLRFLQEAEAELGNHFEGQKEGIFHFGEVRDELRSKIKDVSDEMKKIIERKSLKKDDLDNFRVRYETLIAIKEHLKEIERLINTRVEDLQREIEESTKDNEIKGIASNLINMKILADNLPTFTKKINSRIDESLARLIATTVNKDPLYLAKLSQALQNDQRGVGMIIIAEHQVLKDYETYIFNEETKRHDINYVLKHLEGDDLDKDELRHLYDYFDTSYKKLISKYMNEIESSSNKDLTSLIREIRTFASNNDWSSEKIEWNAQVQAKSLELLPYLFTYWSLNDTEYYSRMKDEDKGESYLKMPHPGQVIAILRMLGFGYLDSKGDENQGGIWNRLTSLLWTRPPVVTTGLRNNLVQVGTGEGKSLVMALVATTLTLLFDIEVKCACYSEYLSQRDYNAFLPMFKKLGIKERVSYGTFNRISEQIINENGDVRELIVNLISNNKKTTKIESNNQLKRQRPKLLLVDEVDVFFTKDFYGNSYTPLARLNDPLIQNLVKFIWKNRKTPFNQKQLSIAQIEASQEFKACVAKYREWEFLFRESVKDMIADLDSFREDYSVLDDKIAYKEQDGISFDVVYGYKTMFAYLNENERGKVSARSMLEHLYLGVNCGRFSYAEIPNTFKHIIGVTGTLKTLTLQERSIVKHVYNITKNTYMPSVFGPNKLKFAQEADIFVENKEDYFIRLKANIEQGLGMRKQRSVMVFFENKQTLYEFFNWEKLKPIKRSIQVITEELTGGSTDEKAMFIKRATQAGQITLLTSVFGRGTDFVVLDHNVIENGGVHVIQAFFSEEYSQEVQIKGRTARQGKDGSFSMVLLDEDLQKYLNVTYKEDIEEMRKNKNTYDTLNTKRNLFYEQKYASLSENIDELKRDHIQSKQFIQHLLDAENHMDAIKKFLSQQNVGSTWSSGIVKSRTICLMDATGSMNHLLELVKLKVNEMFTRASTILRQYDMNGEAFQMQFVIYRDYDTLADGILAYSAWENDATNLRDFLHKVRAYGGADIDEAIEVALWHVNNEHARQKVDQVILIGDAPAKQKQDVLNYRRTYGGDSYWSQQTEFKVANFYKDELERLKQNGIPVHALYLNVAAKANFEEISHTTNGKSEHLNINTEMSAELLTSLVTEKILKNVGEQTGKGETLVTAYKNKYPKAYINRSSG